MEKYGYWLKFPKAMREFLPHDRPYTKMEAAFSVYLDHDESNTVTISGYAALWRWSRKRVKNFLKYMHIQITYPINTTIKQNQRGFLSGVQIPTQIPTQIKLIENRGLPEEGDRQRPRKGSTTRKNKNNKDIYSAVVSHLNIKAGTKYRVSTRTTQALIKARINEGFLEEDFKRVIDGQYKQWKGTDYQKYLRPETLFCAKHFESYLQNALTQTESKPQMPRN